MCELMHKIDHLYQPPKLVEFSTQKKEGKNEKNLYDHDLIDDTDSLLGVPGSEN